MDVQIAPAGPCRKTLTIKVPPKKIQEHVSAVYEAASHQVQMKGFRPGKIPRAVLEKRLGSAILADAKQSLVTECFQEAVKEHKLSMVGRPELAGISDQPLDEKTPLEFQVHVDVRPEFELKSLKGIEIKRGNTEVTESDATSGLDQLAQQKKTLKPVDEAVQEGDFARVDMTFLDESGAQVAERKGAQLNPNIPVAGTDPQTFAAKLRGAQKGDKLEIELTFPETFDKKEVRGQKGKVQILVNEVLRVMAPPLDDAFAKSFDFETLDALKVELHKRIGEEKVRQNQLRQEEEILEILLNDHPFEVPGSLVGDQHKHQLQAYEARLKEAKTSDEEIQKKLAEAEADSRKDAERRVRVFFLIDAIARKEKIFVTESDVDQELRAIAANNGVTPEDARAYYEKQNMISDLRVGIMERKVRNYLRENATLTDR